MKTMKLFLAAAILFASQFTFANNDPKNDDLTLRDDIRKEIIQLIQKGEWKEEIDFNITFYINSKNEILVSNTNNEENDEKIKSLLNYRKINLGKKLKNNTEVYTIPVKIKIK